MTPPRLAPLALCLCAAAFAQGCCGLEPSWLPKDETSQDEPTSKSKNKKDKGDKPSDDDAPDAAPKKKSKHDARTDKDASKKNEDSAPKHDDEPTIPDGPALTTQAPETLGTLTRSEAAAPPWAADFERLAPQIGDAEDVFKALRKPEGEGPLEGALLVCRIHTSGNFDTFRGPDLGGSITVGKAKPISFTGPEDVWTTHLSVPLVHLKEKDRLKVSAWDRDVFETEHIGAAQQPWDGALPIYLQDTNMDVECRAMRRPAVEEAASEQLDRLDAILKKAPKLLKPDPDALHWGYLDTPLPEAQRQCTRSAGYIGWDDPRVQARIERMAELERAWEDVAAASVQKTLAKLPAVGAETPVDAWDLRVKLLSAGCGAEAVKGLKGKEPTGHTDLVRKVNCALRLRVTNTGDQELPLHPFFGQLGSDGLPSLVRPNGRMVSTVLVTITPADGKATTEEYKLQPSQSAEIALLPAEPVELGGDSAQRPQILWFGAQGGKATRLRLP
jgi:hypothetical protein